jgi:hypothetical protein
VNENSCDPAEEDQRITKRKIGWGKKIAKTNPRTTALGRSALEKTKRGKEKEGEQKEKND